MEHIDVDKQVSMIVDDDDIILADSSEAESSNSSPERFRFFTKHGMIRLEDGSMEHNGIKKSFLGSVGPYGNHTNIVAIHKNLHSNLSGQARLETFRIYSEAVAKKCGGNANIRFAWYGASRDEICRIISHGFSCKQPENGQCYGVGIHLSPANFSINSLLSAAEDENGMRHILLCGVILGNMEVVQRGSEQFQPSSDYYDSGVDNSLTPRRYIIWSAYMNSHIFPKYIISFKLSSSFRGIPPNSPYMKISALLSVLSNHLHPSKIALISKYHNDFLVNKINRDELIRHIRQIAGDTLLRSVIKLCKNQTSRRDLVQQQQQRR